MEELVKYLGAIMPQMVIMWGIGGLLIYLAIVKEMEPTLLLPMGFGAILMNLPPVMVDGPQGGVYEVIGTLFNAGIETVIIRDTPTEYRVIKVSDWIENDDSLSGEFGY